MLTPVPLQHEDRPPATDLLHLTMLEQLLRRRSLNQSHQLLGAQLPVRRVDRLRGYRVEEAAVVVDAQARRVERRRDGFCQLPPLDRYIGARPRGDR